MGRRHTYVLEGAEQLDRLIERLEGRPDAIDEGRVFVDGRRVLERGALAAQGQRIEIFEQRAVASGVELIAMDQGLCAVMKPAGISTEPDRHGIESVVQVAAKLVGAKTAGLHALSRLDHGVSGVVLLALDGAARRRVERARAQGELRRRYVAIGAGRVTPSSGLWRGDVNGRDARTRYATIAVAGRSTTKVAGAALRADCPTAMVAGAALRADCPTAMVAGAALRADCPTLFALEPVTGRTHQLRVHAAAAGAPLYGDRTHGGPTRIVKPDGSVRELRRIALHAAWVAIGDDRPFRAEAAIPGDLVELWSDVGGSAEALDHALDDDAVGSE